MTTGSGGPREYSRRDFLHGVAAVGVGGAFTGGLGPWGRSANAGTGGRLKSSDTVSLDYWDWFGGAGGAYMTKMVDAFNASQKNVAVKETKYTLPDYWTKLSSSTSVNKGPGVAALKVSQLNEFVGHGLLTPIDTAQLKKHGLTANDFPKTSWDACHVKGALYAVPMDTEGWVFYYNTKFCQSAGLLADNGQLKEPVGEQAFLSALKAGQSAGAQYGISLDYTSAWNLWYIFYSQLGGKVVSSDGKHVLLDDHKGLQAAELVQEIGAGRNLAPLSTTGADIGTLFAEEKAAFMSSWAAAYVDFVKTRHTPFDVTYVPKIFNHQVTIGDTSVFVIPRHRNQSKGEVDAALAFFAGALKHSIYWAQGAHIPDYLPVRQMKAFKALLPQAHFSSVANYVVYLPRVSYLTELNTNASAPWSSVFTGHTAPKAGYQQFRSQLEQLTRKA